MAVIEIKIGTSEHAEERSRGHWGVRIDAGLDEDPKGIMAEALKRIETAVNSLPPEKRFPRFKSELN